jgi:phage baseplate assembly protein V
MEDVMNVRSGAVRGVVQSIDDTGQVQMATVQTHDGVMRQVEVWQLDGFASVPSGDGAIALLFASGNDPSQFIALLANPSTRYGKQAAGERTMAMPDGTRVSVQQGGTVAIWGGNLVTVTAPDVTINTTGNVTVNAGGSVTIIGQTATITAADGLTINAADGLTINGNIALDGSLVATGLVIDHHGTL